MGLTPRRMQRLHGCLTVFWMLATPAAYLAGLLSSVTFVSALSLWALVSGHWSAWESARVEVKQEDDADVQDVIDLINARYPAQH